MELTTSLMESVKNEVQQCKFLLPRGPPPTKVNINVSHADIGNTSTTPMVEYFLMALENATHVSTVAKPSPAPPPDHGVYQWFNIVIPIICFIGILGNLVNLVVLTRRRLLSSMGRLERCATYGLAALALSDMMFCISVVPVAFIQMKPSLTRTPMMVFSLYYRIYGIALINLFMTVSNWLTVVIAVNRFLVVTNPIHARNILSTGKTLASIILVLVCSTALTLPYFMHLRVAPCMGKDGRLLLELSAGFSSISQNLRIYMRWVFPIFSVFIPLALLAFCNAYLIHTLRKARLYRRNSARGARRQDSSNKVTLTLVIIVLMLLLLVSPSEILKYINPYKSWGKVGYTIAHVTNVLQATNFALNFFLYLVVNPNFRRVIVDTFFCFKRKQDKLTSTETKSKSINGHTINTTKPNSCQAKTGRKYKSLSKREMENLLNDSHTTVTSL